MSLAGPGVGPADIVVAFAGLVGVTVSIYIQMISRRRCPWKYTVGFFVGGSGLLLLHPELYLPAALSLAGDWFSLIGAFAILAVEIVAIWHVFAHYRVETPAELLVSLVHRLFGNGNGQ